MALEFRKRLFHKPGKKTQYALAFTALLLALCLLFCWMYIRHKLDKMPTEDPSSDSSTVSSTVYTAEDKANLLVIYNSDTVTRFILVQADPAQGCVNIAAIPREITVSHGATLTAIYRKNGAAQVVSELSTALDLPLRHFVAVTESKAATWFGRLEGGLPFTLPETIEQTTNGITTTLSAGKTTLSATQAVTVLNHTQWQDKSLDDRIGADVIAAMLDAYMTPSRHLATDFSKLANLTQTSLRIGDFNDRKVMLTYLAGQNDGTLCQVFPLPVTADAEGRISPDVAKFKKSVFYDRK